MDGSGPGEAWSYFADRLPDTLAWMGLNLALALVPLVLAYGLFRRASRTSVGWWIGFGAFVAFLPNAAYVWSSYVWFFGQIRSAWVLDQWRIPLLIPMYSAYFAIGSVSFVLCLRWARDFLLTRWTRTQVDVVVVALCGCTALGVYLGRVDYNSWSLVSDLPGVLRALSRLPAHGAATARTVLAFAAALALVTGAELVRSWRGRAGDDELEATDDVTHDATGEAREGSVVAVSVSSPAAPAP